MKRVASECCQLYSRTLQLSSERCGPTAGHDNPVSWSVFGSWAVLQLRVSYTATSNGEVTYGEAEGTRQKGAIAGLTVSTLALDYLTKTAFPVVEFRTRYHQNCHSGRFGQCLPALF
jgi:hypothetical protein